MHDALNVPKELSLKEANCYFPLSIVKVPVPNSWGEVGQLGLDYALT
ncbi:MAG: hypothetical protein RI947_1439 [Candidatus Parcubacteria bacterium]|jgi:outer membrane protein W